MTKSLALLISLQIYAPLSAQELTSSKVIPELMMPPNAKLAVIGDNKSHGIFSPTALCLDEKGNILITETWRFMDNRGIDDNRQRRFWVKEDIASRSTADRLKLYERYYDKIKPEHYTTHSEKIRILTDPNNDGVFDANKVYADQFNHPLDGTAAGIFSLNGTTYFACIPHIWALKDKDGDGISDERKSLQDGFGVHVSLSGHDLNGFALSPDGRIYATIGDRGLNIKTKEGKQWILSSEGSVIRFDPDGSNMEIIHTGLRNPKEIAFDQFGNGISVDNNSDQGDQSRVVYIVDQADSGWDIGHQVLHSFHDAVDLAEHPINRWMAEKMWEPENDAQPAFILPPIANFTGGPSGLTYDPGVGAHPDFAGKFLVCDFRGASTNSSINSFGIEPAGASLKFVNPKLFNTGVTPTDVEYGYAGGLYVTDFQGGWISKAQGRVYKITPDQPVHGDKVNEVKSLISQGIETLPVEKLENLLGHPDMRVRLRAQLALASKNEAVTSFTKAVTQSENQLKRLHGVWGLGVLARKNDDQKATAELIKWIADKDSEVRTQVMKTLGEAPMNDALTTALAQGLIDTNQRVSFHAALSIGRHSGIKLQKQAIDFIMISPTDAYHRHAGHIALIATTPDLTSLQNHASEKVRLAAVLGLKRQKSPALVNSLNDSDPKVYLSAIQAIHDQQLTDLQPAVAKLIDKPLLKLTPMMQRRLIYSAFRSGGAENIKRLCHFAADQSRDIDQRKEAFRLLDIWLTPPSTDQSLGKHSPITRDSNESKIHTDTLTTEVKSLLNSDVLCVKNAFYFIQKFKLNLPDLTPSKLGKLIEDDLLDDSVRVQILTLLTSKSPEIGVSEAKKFSVHKNTALAIESLKILVKLAPQYPATHQVLIEATSREQAQIQQQSWLLFNAQSVDKLNDHLVKAIANLSDNAQQNLAAIEILEVAKSSKDPKVIAALNTYQSSLQASDPLAPWLPSLYGGDAKNGEQIFLNQGAAQCAKCHNYHYNSVHDGGGNAGPNLSGVAKRYNHLRKDLLEAIIVPNAAIAVGFGTVTVEFEKGNVTGNYLANQPDGIIVQIGNDPTLIPHTEYKNLIFSPSSMPSMKEKLTPREARDVIAFLDSLSDDSKNPKIAPIKAKPFDIKSIQATEPGKEIPLAEKQKQLYDMNCMACHQANGEGNVTFPPLAKSEWVAGDKDTLIKMQLLGLNGPIKVKGKVYNGIPMPSNARLNDEEIANVLTYVRSSWGNNASEITAAEIAKLRKEIGNSTTPLDASKLIHPDDSKPTK